MKKNGEKKNFWASLFIPKSCCCCGPQIEEIKEDQDNERQKKESEDNDPDESDSSSGIVEKGKV